MVAFKIEKNIEFTKPDCKVTMNVSISKEMKELVLEIAKKENLSMSSIVQQLIGNALKQLGAI